MVLRSPFPGQQHAEPIAVLHLTILNAAQLCTWAVGHTTQLTVCSLFITKLYQVQVRQCMNLSSLMVPPCTGRKIHLQSCLSQVL